MSPHPPVSACMREDSTMRLNAVELIVTLALAILVVALAAVPEDDRLHQRRPVEIVDVVERRAGADQLLHHCDVPEVRGSAELLGTACGWRPEIPLGQTVADALDAWRAQLRTTD